MNTTITIDRNRALTMATANFSHYPKVKELGDKIASFLDREGAVSVVLEGADAVLAEAYLTQYGMLPGGADRQRAEAYADALGGFFKDPDNGIETIGLNGPDEWDAYWAPYREGSDWLGLALS